MGWGEYCAANGLALSSGMSGSSSQMFCDLSQQEEAFLPRDSLGDIEEKKPLCVAFGHGETEAPPAVVSLR